MSEHKPYPQEHPHFIQGREHERARIIELVERFIPNPHTINDGCESCNLHRTILALIKESE